MRFHLSSLWKHLRVSSVTQPLVRFAFLQNESPAPYSRDPHLLSLWLQLAHQLFSFGLGVLWVAKGRETRGTDPSTFGPSPLCYLHPTQVRSLSLGILPPPSPKSCLLRCIQAAFTFRPSAQLSMSASALARSAQLPDSPSIGSCFIQG